MARDSVVDMAYTVWDLNPGWGEISRTLPDRQRDPISILYSGYRGCFPGVERPGRRVDHAPSSIAEVKEKVELYVYSPSVPSRQVTGETSIPLTCRLVQLLLHVIICIIAPK
jgi:hypothetical protein